MIRSLYSGVSGMKNHQIRMDVTGNNIANVNTSGYKKGRVNFQDTLYQTLSSGGNSKNPAQVGAGMSVGSITNNFTQGPLQNTGRTLDLAIQGDGFFAVSKYKGDLIDSTNDKVKNTLTSADTKSNYTREGVFFVDKDGYIVNSNGMNLIGLLDDKANTDPADDVYGAVRILLKDNSGTDEVPLSVEALTITPGGKITGTYTNGDKVQFDYGTGKYNDTTSKTEAQIAIVTFANNEGLIKEGDNVYKESAETSGDAVFGVPTDSVQINSGYLEMSNVDLTEEFTTMITTQRGYQANARVITTSDSMLEELINLKR